MTAVLEWTERCNDCAAEHDITDLSWRCPCGGLLDIAAPEGLQFLVEDLPWSMWRYRSMLMFARLWDEVTMGEGMTPMVGGLSDTSDRPPVGTGSASGGPSRLYKLDFVSPTLSYKDRGAAMLVALAKEVGTEKIIVDSSGNAGVAMSAYSARAGIPIEVFVPQGTSKAKTAAIAAHGGAVREVPGGRTETARAAQDAVAVGGAVYGSHVYQPLFMEGLKTVSYEIYEQVGSRAPSGVVMPVGNGSLLLGVAKGFEDLRASGAIPTVPRLVAVQGANVSPIARMWAGQEPRDARSTVAAGAAIANPARARQVLEAVSRSGGTVLTATESEILEAKSALASRGIFVEPTSALVEAAWGRYAGAAAVEADGPVVLVLTGAGLKDTGSLPPG